MISAVISRRQQEALLGAPWGSGGKARELDLAAQLAALHRTGSPPPSEYEAGHKGAPTIATILSMREGGGHRRDAGPQRGHRRRRAGPNAGLTLAASAPEGSPAEVSPSLATQHASRRGSLPS